MPMAMPEYRRIRESLREQLVAGKLRPGDRIPAERELGDRFGVTHMTVRHAVDGLVREGLLVRRRGSGTFVVDGQAISRSINRLQGFTEDVGGGRAGAKVITSAEIDPNEEVARMLELPKRSKVVELVRVRTVNDQPVAINRVWIPVRVAPGLASQDMTDRSLYAYLDEVGVTIERAEQRLFAVAATPWHASHLGVARGKPLLASVRLSRNPENVPVEYAHGWTLPDLPVWVELRR
jgi:GntR family transcriptional regulator